MAFIRSIIDCMCHIEDDKDFRYCASNGSSRSNDDIASEIVDKIYAAEKSSSALKTELHNIVFANGWSEYLAEAVLSALESAIRAGRVMGLVIKDAYDRAVEAAMKVKEFADANPLFFSLIALGIIALLMPWLLEALGFGLEGIIERSLAARWQSMYGGWVPKGSLFSYLQSLGTKLHWF